MLTLKCPRCTQAFIDFVGCFALSCSRQGCGCNFCALCLADCGEDAHPHLAAGLCRTEKDYWGTLEELNANHAKRRTDGVVKYLEGLNPAMRALVVAAIEVDMAQLELKEEWEKLSMDAE